MNSIKERLSWIPFLIKSNLFYNRGDLVNIRFKGIDFLFKIIPDKDIHSLSRNLQAYKIREPMNSMYFKDWIEKKDILLDIGANLGYFTILGKNAKKIIAIEPLKKCIPLLKINLKMNKIKGVETLNLAIGKKNGKIFFKESDALNLSKPSREKGSFLVESKTLKYFADKYNINTIKSDMEGYEYEIFGKSKIPEKINKIAMELHVGLIGKEKSNKLIENMYKNGFYAKCFFEDIPLRLYPFVRFGLLFKFFSWKEGDLSIERVKHLVNTGRRSVKYIYWEKFK